MRFCRAGACYTASFTQYLEDRVPLYEYQCAKCGKRTEKIEPVSGPHLQKCPHCRGKVERLVTAPAIQFKGSGWYVTDYAGKASKKEAPAFPALQFQRFQVGAEGFAEFSVLQSDFHGGFQESEFLTRIVGRSLIDVGQ